MNKAWWDGYRQGIADTYLNRELSEVADNSDKFGDIQPDDPSGKAIRYYGWYWRDVEWSADHVMLASDDGSAERAGFCENNKWDYAMRLIRAEAWDKIRAVAAAIGKTSIDDEKKKLVADLNAALTAAWAA